MTKSNASIYVAAILLAGTLQSVAAERINGPVHVCRKPMLAGSAAFAAGANPGPDVWKQLATRQAEQARYCYIAGSVQILEKGPDIDVGLNTICSEWMGTANGETVFVAIGPKRTWGTCP